MFRSPTLLDQVQILLEQNQFLLDQVQILQNELDAERCSHEQTSAELDAERAENASVSRRLQDDASNELDRDLVWDAMTLFELDCQIHDQQQCTGSGPWDEDWVPGSVSTTVVGSSYANVAAKSTPVSVPTPVQDPLLDLVQDVVQDLVEAMVQDPVPTPVQDPVPTPVQDPDQAPCVAESSVQTQPFLKDHTGLLCGFGERRDLSLRILAALRHAGLLEPGVNLWFRITYPERGVPQVRRFVTVQVDVPDAPADDVLSRYCDVMETAIIDYLNDKETSIRARLQNNYRRT